MKELSRLIYFLFSIATAMVGYKIHHSLIWSIVDFLFTFIAWGKWLICHEVTAAIIRDTFSFFTQ